MVHMFCVQADLEAISDLVPDHCNKVNTAKIRCHTLFLFLCAS